jgi:hypothetical protein
VELEAGAPIPTGLAPGTLTSSSGAGSRSTYPHRTGTWYTNLQ